MGESMLKGLSKPTMIGTVLQVGMILLGKVSPMVGQNFAIGGTSIAAITGVLGTTE